MAAGAYARQISGDCLRVPTRNGLPAIVQPWRKACLHLLLGPPPGLQNLDSGTYACGFNTDASGNPVTTTPGTAPLPVPSLVAKTAYGSDYGRTPDDGEDPVSLMALDGRDIYVKAAELQPWRKRPLYTNNLYRNYASGPAVVAGHCVIPMERRLRRQASPNNEDYRGRMQFDFTDADAPIFGQSDWQGPLHPAMPFWTNVGVPEPFLANTHYERGGAELSQTANHLGMIPFCAALPARDSAGTQIGQYVGYSVIAYWSMGFVHFGDAEITRYDDAGNPTYEKVFLPEDYRAEINPVTGKRPKIQNHYQTWMLDTTWFMVGTGGIGSPRLGTTRWWFYNDPRTAPDPGDEYMYMIHGALQSRWAFPVQFNLVGGGQESILFNLSSARGYISP